MQIPPSLPQSLLGITIPMPLPRDKPESPLTLDPVASRFHPPSFPPALSNSLHLVGVQGPSPAKGSSFNSLGSPSAHLSKILSPESAPSPLGSTPLLTPKDNIPVTSVTDILQVGRGNEWTRERKQWLQNTIRGLGGGWWANWCKGRGGAARGSDPPTHHGCHRPCIPSLKEKRQSRSGHLPGKRSFLHRGGGNIPNPSIPLTQEQDSWTARAWQGTGPGLCTLEPALLPSREPGAQEGTAHSASGMDRATGSGRAALCQCPELQGLVAAGGGGALLRPLGTWLSQMPQPGSVSGTCVRAFCISINS